MDFKINLSLRIDLTLIILLNDSNDRKLYLKSLLKCIETFRINYSQSGTKQV